MLFHYLDYGFITKCSQVNQMFKIIPKTAFFSLFITEFEDTDENYKIIKDLYTSIDDKICKNV